VLSFLGTRRVYRILVFIEEYVLGGRKVCFMWEQLCFVNESVAGQVIFCSSFTDSVVIPIGCVFLFKGLYEVLKHMPIFLSF